MGLWDFLVIVVVAGIIGEAYKQHTKAKMAQPNSDLERRIEALEKDDEDLDERVKVLETIVTDDKFELDRKINSL